MKILIMASRFFMGGFTKSLVNFLLCADKYEELDITVLTIEKNETDDYKDIPKRFKYIDLGMLSYSDPIKRGLNREYILNPQRVRNLEYVIVEKLSKIRKKEFPHKTAMKFMSYSEAERAGRVTTDFSFCEQYDIAISWEEVFCNYLLADKIPAKKKIGYIHPNYTEALFCKEVDRPYLKKLDGIVTISQSCKEELCRVFPEYRSKIVNLPNRLNIERLTRLSQQYSPELQVCRYKLLTVCRMVDNHKAVFRVVNLARRLKKSGVDFVWYLIGDGSDFNELKCRIKKNDVEDRIVCLGQLDNPCPYMKAADLYVMQSHYEGRPVAVDEAMALGTPALLTKYSSAIEQVTDGKTGWIVSDDEEQIYSKLLYILSNPQEIKNAKKRLKSISNAHYEDCQPIIDFLNGIGK